MYLLLLSHTCERMEEIASFDTQPYQISYKMKYITTTSRVRGLVSHKKSPCGPPKKIMNEI